MRSFGHSTYLDDFSSNFYFPFPRFVFIAFENCITACLEEKIPILIIYFSFSAIESDNDEDERLPVDDYYFVQPIATRQRRTLLKQAGLIKIDTTEKHELTLIRRSREVCGCSCTRETGGCQPLTCDCYLNGIACQVDRLTFPCPCATMLCKNPLGRLEFNQNRVRNHFVETITRLEAEKNQEELGKIYNTIIKFIYIKYF